MPIFPKKKQKIDEKNVIFLKALYTDKLRAAHGVHLQGKVLIDITKKLLDSPLYDYLFIDDASDLKYSFLLKTGKTFYETHGFQYTNQKVAQNQPKNNKN